MTMLKVFKYELDAATDRPIVLLPPNAKVLSFGFQGHQPVIWALVDPDAQPQVTREFRLAGTGHLINEDAGDLHFVGTASVSLLWFHLFEITKF